MDDLLNELVCHQMDDLLHELGISFLRQSRDVSKPHSDYTEVGLKSTVSY